MKTKKRTIKAFVAVIAGGILFQSCKKEPNPSEANELITSLKVIMTDSANTNNKLVFSFIDLDGDKPNLPTQFDSIVLAPNSTYYATLQLLDESKNPVDTVSNEIIEKANDHLFVYKPNPASLVAVQISDKDSKNLPIGLLSTWRTSGIGKGTTTIVLRHQPDVKNGTEAPGDSDIEVVFPTIIK